MDIHRVVSTRFVQPCVDMRSDLVVILAAQAAERFLHTILGSIPIPTHQPHGICRQGLLQPAKDLLEPRLLVPRWC